MLGCGIQDRENRDESRRVKALPGSGEAAEPRAESGRTLVDAPKQAETSFVGISWNGKFRARGTKQHARARVLPGLT